MPARTSHHQLDSPPPGMRLGWRPVVAVAIALMLVWVQSLVSQWVGRTWAFVSFLAVVAVLVMLLDWMIELIGPKIARLAASLARSIWRGVVADPEVVGIAARHPRSARWIRSRVALDRPSGLILTLSTVSALYFLTGFISIARDVATASAVTRYDVQVSALLRAFRAPVLSRFLWVFTVLGDVKVAIALAALAAALLAMWGRRLEAALLVASVGGGALISSAAKAVFHRSRPPAVYALIHTPESFSFPSGHALNSLLFATCLALILCASVRTIRRKLAVAGVASGIIVLTGLSRIYLGVHWMSDVFASWMLGLAWLSVCLGGYMAAVRFGRWRQFEPLGSADVRKVLAGAVTAIAAAAIIFGAQADPLLGRVASASAPVAWHVATSPDGLPRPTAAQVHELPRVSEKLDGTPQEPVGMIFVGTRTQLVGAFTAAGWRIADQPSPLTLLRAGISAVANKPYATAPVTPSFLAGRVQDVAFEKAQGTATVRRRHHCRWWRTRFVLGGRPVWVATASFDSRLEVGSAIPLPTHHIDPNIDAEQTYTVRDLISVGIKAAARVRVSPASAGTNAQGDEWFTQGMATLLVP